VRQVGEDGAVDVAVDALGADQLDDTAGRSTASTSIAAAARNPVITAREGKRATHQAEEREQKEQHPGRDRDRRNQLRRVMAPSPVASTAPPATAASDELGPVDICRAVQKSA
jgi:hypothetical protein